jgi:prepilin-type N-terminal cleavage/methylation domain-containing protein
MKPKPSPNRRAMTLIELLVASALTAVILTSSFMLVGTGHAAWTAQQADYVPLASAHAAVRHVVRHVRQARAVAALDPAGSLSLLMPSGQTLVWQYDSAGDRVLFGVGSADDLLAEQITDLTLTGYEADGVTLATDVSEVHLIRCDAQVVLPRGAGATQTISSWAWMRSW